MERRLAAIFAADVVGYSKMMEKDEAGTLSALSGLIKEFIEPLVTSHNGRIVKFMGDGILAEFGSVVDAVTCAIAWQGKITEKDSNLQFRIGINLGEIIIQDDDIFGTGVNVASRLEGLSIAGGICISDDVYRQIKGNLEFVFEDMGEQQLKNIDEPVRTYRLGDQIQSQANEPDMIQERRLTLSEKPSIAVLPFDNMSGDPEQGFFSDGIADDIITDLSRYGELFVIARQSTFAFHDRDETAYEFASHLGVEYVLEGSVRRAGERARVTAKLVEVRSQTTLWAERFDREVRDILDVQDEIASVIVNTLVGRLVYRHYTRVRLLDADAVTAYEHTLKAQHHIWAFSPEDIRLAKREAELAIGIDPNYARAHAVLAWALQTQGSMGWSDDPDRPFDKALEHAKAAVAADENEPWGHCVLGFTLFSRDRDFKRGLDEVRLAAKLNPSNAHFRMLVGATLAYMGQGEEALKEIDIAMRLNPLHPGLYLIHQSRAFFVAGKYEDALSQIERAVVALPAHAVALALLAACYAVLGRIESAAKVISDLKLASPDFTLKYVRHFTPFANSADLDHFCNLLQEAGLPE